MNEFGRRCGSGWYCKGRCKWETVCRVGLFNRCGSGYIWRVEPVLGFRHLTREYSFFFCREHFILAENRVELY